MEQSKIGCKNCRPDKFFDDLDEFMFFDCVANAGPEEESVESSMVSRFEFVEDRTDKLIIARPSLNRFRRRSSFRYDHRGIPDDNSKDSNSNLPLISEISQVCEAIPPRDRRNKILYALKDHERSNSPRFRLIEQSDESAIEESPMRDLDDSSSNFLLFLAGLLIKAVGFQISLFFRFFSFPIWLLYCSFMFVVDPFWILKRAKEHATKKLLGMLKVQKSMGELAVRFGWGFFWSVYVWFMLFCFLVSGFVLGGLMMRYVVVEPIQMTETLNFDYSKASPIALVPIMSCSSVSCGMNCKEMVEVGKNVGSRVIPPEHKLQLAISLTMPESEYNRKLGVFQVRVEFLTANGKVTDSSSYPCMLRFKSQFIRSMETILKSAPLLAGYSSEAQDLDLKIRGFTEGNEPTSCIRVMLEQRAEYRPNAGIPEIYAASMAIESELPLIKRILWYWRKTIFVWTSMVSFVMELTLILVFCRPIIFPRARPRWGSAKKIAPQNTIAQIKWS